MKGNAREIEKCRSDLSDMLKLPENRYCADCGSKQPTWASTNIGVFVCIRCSGIHRNLGTHISKVKSTTLDSWTFRLLQHFKAQGGNIAVNLCYESRLPKHEKPTESTDTYRLEQFIRTKYAARKWFEPPKQTPPQVNKVQPEKEKEKKVTPPAIETKPPVRNVVVNKTPVKPVPPKKPVQDVPDLLPREMLASNSEPEDLLSFMHVSENGNAKPTNVQNNRIETEKANVSTGVSGFGFINASNGVTSPTITTIHINQPSKPVAAITVKPIQPPKLNNNTNNNNESINLMDSPQAKNSKDSILSMYKQQPLFQQMGPKTSEAFMTQLPPNMSPFAAPTQKQPPAQTGIAPGHNVAIGFNGTFNPQPTSNNPYTMLNNQSNRPLF